MLEGKCEPKGVRGNKGVGVGEDEHGCCRDRRCLEGVCATIGYLGGRDGGVVAENETSVVVRRHGGEHVSRSGLPW